MRKQLLIVCLFVLALRLPFLNQAIQGDDVDYLYGAEHAQVEPLHPHHTSYAFLGRMVNMSGHPHPPLNAWYLGLLLAIFKDISEVPFHAAYLLFSLIAAASALALARRFSPHPLLAALIFLVTPAFVINGTSLESDLPFTAFWLLSTALFVAAVDSRSYRLLAASMLAMTFAALAAFQAVLLVPILLLYGRKWRVSWIAACTVPAVLGGWQLFERMSMGTLPAGALAGYLQSYNFEAFTQKVKSAVALTSHLAWQSFPGFWIPSLALIPVAIGAAFYDYNPLFWGSIAIGVGILWWCIRNWRDFLAQWVLIFFAGALVIFFAGSARYLLPLSLPIAILATRRASLRLLKVGFAFGLTLSVLLAIVNYQHWDGYRQFARSLQSDAQTKRVWINDEWGLRYYLESEGALPLLIGQTIRPGDMIVASTLGYPRQFPGGGGVLVTAAERVITSQIPLRLVALNGRSAYSTTMFGLRPFDVSLAPMDRVYAETLVEKKPTVPYLPMNAPEADQQIVSGVYQLEESRWRWMARNALILLKPPPDVAVCVVKFYVPDSAPARSMTLTVNDLPAGSLTWSAPGTYQLVSSPLKLANDSARVSITVDKSFTPAGRELGVVLLEVGFR